MEKKENNAIEFKNYFDNLKRARAFAQKNDSKVERVNLDSTRRYLVKTKGVGIR